MYSPPSHPSPMPPLSRYGSAPGSLLKSLVDEGGFSGAGASIVGNSDGLLGRYFSGESASCKEVQYEDRRVIKIPPPGPLATAAAASSAAGLERAGYRYTDMGVGDFKQELPPESLIRHSSSPAGLLMNQFIVDSGGYSSMTRGAGNYNSRAGGSTSKTPKLQLSFSRQDSLISQVSDITMADFDGVGDVDLRRTAAGDGPSNGCSQSYNMGSWDASTSIHLLPCSPGKRSKDINVEIVAAHNNVDSQLNMKCVDMDGIEKFLQLQQDCVPCKVRAKRGCATHPRSIAERDRRTRISEKLRKLQEIMPNTDKQTNTAEMLDFAVHYIKSLQNQLQELQQERTNCTCARRHD